MPPKKKIRILLTGSLYLWGGGVDFVANIAKALSCEKGKSEVEVFVCLPTVSFARKAVVKLRMLTRKIKARLTSHAATAAGQPTAKGGFKDVSYRIPTKAIARTFRSISPRIKVVYHHDSDEGARTLFAKLKPDVALPIMPAASPAFTSSCPWVGYIFDYQHKYYPEFFNDDVQTARDAQFRDLLNGTSAVMVNSKTAEADIAKFHPGTRAKVFVSPFAPLPDHSWFRLIKDAGLAEQIKQKYSLPERYFVICNQFWIHKSHITAFEAFGQLLKDESYKDVHLVCTGKQSDPRNPQLFAELTARIKELGIEKNMHFLGFVPKDEQIVIMNGSLAVIQPTLFEGWPGGGSVYDAVSIGVPCLISDIPTNLGAKGKNISFFKARDGKSLADVIRVFLSKPIVRPDESYLLQADKAAAEALYDRLMEAIAEATSAANR